MFGTGTSLDTARLKKVLAENLKVDRRLIQAVCLGEHGESSMIPFSSITIGQKPFYEYIGQHPELQINTNEHRILPVSAYLEGEYGKNGLHIGVPVVISANGIEQMIELGLDDAEAALFDDSCNFAGMAAGLMTGILQTKLKIYSILASILTMTSLYTANLGVMGSKSNVSLLGQNIIFIKFMELLSLQKSRSQTIVSVIVCLFVIVSISIFFRTRTGLAIFKGTDNNDDDYA